MHLDMSLSFYQCHGKPPLQEIYKTSQRLSKPSPSFKLCTINKILHLHITKIFKHLPFRAAKPKSCQIASCSLFTYTIYPYMPQTIFKVAVKVPSLFSIHGRETNRICKYFQLSFHLPASCHVPIPSSPKAKKGLCNYL